MDIPTIHKRIREVEIFKDKNKVARESLRNELENNPEYLEVCDEFKVLLQKRKRIRDEIWAQVETQKLVTDIKENKEELNTLEDILSVELMDYYKEKETDEIEDEFGETRRFKIVVKLLPKAKKYDERDAEGKYASKVEPFIKELHSQEN